MPKGPGIGPIYAADVTRVTITVTVKDSQPPVVSNIAASTLGSFGATISWSTDELADSRVDFGLDTTYANPAILDSNLVIEHRIELAGLTANTLFHFRVTSKDANANTTTSNDLTFTTEPLDMTPPAITNVFVSNISATGVTVNWQTDEAADTQIEYGFDTNYDSTTTLQTGLVTQHAQAVTGLAPSTTYHYRVLSQDANGNRSQSGDFTFTTSAFVAYVQRVNAGGQAYTGNGKSWAGDQAYSAGSWGYVGGRTFAQNTQIANTTDDALYQSERFNMEAYRFTMPVNGTYRVTLHFAEIFYRKRGLRLFDVLLENQPALDNLDIFGEAGRNVALAHAVETEVANGVLDITFTAVKDNPKISAIEVESVLKDTFAPFVSNVAVSTVSSDSAVITWNTNEDGDSQVEWGVDTTYGNRSPLDSELTTFHTVTLSGLTPETQYHYRALSRDSSGNQGTSKDGTFSTPKEKDTTPPAITILQPDADSITNQDSAIVDAILDDATVDSIQVNGKAVVVANDTFKTTLPLHEGLNTITVTAKDSLDNQNQKSLNITKDTQPPLRSGLSIAKLSSNSATFTWSTNEATTDLVRFGEGGRLDRERVADSNLTTSHTLTLTKLLPETEYTYQVFSVDRAGNQSSSDQTVFTTLSPEDWLIKLTDDILTRAPDPAQLPLDDWKITTRMQGIMRAYEATGKAAYLDYLQQWIAGHLDQAGNIALNNNDPDPFPGMIILALYEITEQLRYLTAAQQLADHYFATVLRTSDGTTVHTLRLRDQVWCDTVNGIALFFAKLASVTGDSQYFDEAVQQLILHAKHLQDGGTGLFYHGWDEDGSAAWADPTTHRSPEFWSRGASWLAIAIPDVLDYLPLTYSGRDSLIAIFQKLMQGFIDVQDAATGLWFTVLDKGARPDNFQDTAGSAQIAYGLARGIFRGYVDKSLQNNLDRAKVGLLTEISEDVAGVQVNDVTEGTSVGDYDYYVSRKLGTGIQYPYGDGAYLMAQAALRTMTRTPAQIRIESGNGQTALLHTPLPQSLRIKVLTADSQAVAGVRVFFNVTKGGGTLSRPNPVVTAGDGTAWDRWTLGGLSGRQTVEVRAEGLATRISFGATAFADTTPPAIGNVAVASITTDSASITWATDEAADTQVAFGVDTTYGTTSALQTELVTSHSQVLTGLNAGTTYHFQVRSRDASGNLAVSADFSFTTVAPDTTPPVISQVAAQNLSASQATITWSTDEAADSEVVFGVDTTYDTTSALQTELVTSHSQVLTGLQAGTTYHFQARSRDASGNLAV
ncbi:MAG: glycoside hydrolase family 88 protein, partial [bacterium]